MVQPGVGPSLARSQPELCGRTRAEVALALAKKVCQSQPTSRQHAGLVGPAEIAKRDSGYFLIEIRNGTIGAFHSDSFVLEI
jgi:hypothetical protein